MTSSPVLLLCPIGVAFCAGYPSFPSTAEIVWPRPLVDVCWWIVRWYGTAHTVLLLSGTVGHQAIIAETTASCNFRWRYDNINQYYSYSGDIATLQ